MNSSLSAYTSQITRTLLLIVVVLVVITGCNDPKAANKENFELVINKYLQGKSSQRCSPLWQSFPAAPDAGRYPNSAISKSYIAGWNTKANELISLDLLIASNDTNSYELTEKGRNYFRKKEGPEFCFGTPEIVDIIKFTEPSNVVGMTISKVKYTYKVTGIPKWALESSINYGFFEKSTQLKEDKTMLILTNEGWEAQSR